MLAGIGVWCACEVALTRWLMQAHPLKEDVEHAQAELRSEIRATRGELADARERLARAEQQLADLADSEDDDG